MWDQLLLVLRQFSLSVLEFLLNISPIRSFWFHFILCYSQSMIQMIITISVNWFCIYLSINWVLIPALNYSYRWYCDICCTEHNHNSILQIHVVDTRGLCFPSAVWNYLLLCKKLHKNNYITICKESATSRRSNNLLFCR